MDTVPALHPADETLHAYGLGKLDDPSAEEVNRHLEACPDCRRRVAEMSADSFLGRVRDGHRGQGMSTVGPSRIDATRSHVGAGTPPPPAAETLPPGLADHPDYEIKRELGRGGMGVVYLAHNRLMGRDEVLKVMGREIVARPGLLDRFLREIRAVARLRHPNIVTAYSAVRIEESIVFAMEHVEGLDLSKLVKIKGPMPVAHACYFIHQAALGLQHAHEEGLVHRDIKPGNLILSRKGDRATVKVLDFGLAKATREAKVDSALTHAGQALGTPDYIAPEQILDASTADIRADIYSLGGTLFYLLTGRPPFLAASLYDLYQAHISRDADPLNLLRPEVPAELAALVAKMMAKDPSRRFPTPVEVADALKPFFRKGNQPPAPVTEVSQGGHSIPDQSRPRAVSAPTQPATGMRPASPPRPSVEPSRPESMWASLVDFRETERSIEGLSPTPTAPSKRPPRHIRGVAIAAAASLVGLVLMGVLIKIRNQDGTVTTIEAPEGAKVVVEGRSEDVEFRPLDEVDRADTRDEATVRFEDSDGDAATGSVGSEFVSLFNGEDFTGWTFPFGNEADWSVTQDGVIRGVASEANSTLATARTDYADFELRMLVRTTDIANKHFVFRCVGSAEDERNYRFVTGGIKVDGEIDPLGGFRIKNGGPLDTPNFDMYGIRVITAPTMQPMTKDLWHEVRITAIGNIFRMVVDGREVAAFEDLESRLSEGRIDFRLRNGATLEIREVEIRKLTVGTPPVPPADEPYASLFNGATLDGWRFPCGNRSAWSVEDGCLVGRENGELSIITTDRSDYRDFRLRMEVQNLNEFVKSVYLRADIGPETLSSYHFSLGGLAPAIRKLKPLGTYSVVTGGSPIDPSQFSTDDTLELTSPTLQLLSSEEWHVIEIEAVGHTFRMSVDGREISAFQDTRARYDEGRIGFRLGGGGLVKFRKIEIQELDEEGKTLVSTVKEVSGDEPFTPPV